MRRQMATYQGDTTASVNMPKTSHRRQPIGQQPFVNQQYPQRGGARRMMAIGPLVKIPSPQARADNSHQLQRKYPPRTASNAAKVERITQNASRPSRTSNRPTLTNPGARLRANAPQKAARSPKLNRPNKYVMRMQH